MQDLGLGITVALKDLFSSNAKKVTNSIEGMNNTAQKTSGVFGKMQGALNAVVGGVLFQKSKQLFRDLINPAIDFEQELLKISTFTDDGAASVGFLREEILKLTNLFGTEFGEQAAGSLQLMQSGFTNTADVFKMLVPINKLADASFTSLETSIYAVSKIMKTYNLSGGDAAKVANSLLLASRQGKIGLSELTGFMQNALPVAENLGVGYEEILSVMTSMTKQGVPSRQALMSISQVMIALTENARKLDPFMKKHGDRTLENTIKNRGLINTLNGMFTNQEKSKKLFEELGIQGKSWQNLLNVLGPNFDLFASSLKELKGNEGTLDEVFSVVDSSTTEQLKDIKTALRDIFVLIGSELLTVIKPAIVKMAEWSKIISVWVREHPKVAKVLGLVVFGLTALIVVASALLVVMGAAAAISAGFAAGLGEVLVGVVGLAAGLGIFYTAFKKFRPYLQPILNWFSDAWMVISHDIQRSWAVVVGTIKMGIDKIQPLLQIATTGFEILKKAVVAVFDAISDSIDRAIERVTKLIKMMPGGETLLKGFDFLKNNFGKISEMVGSVINPGFGLVSLIKNRATSIKNEELPKVGRNLGSFKNFKDDSTRTGARDAGITRPERKTLQQAASSAVTPMITVTPPIVNNTINVPKIQVSSSDVVIDKRVLGNIIFEMQQLSTVRQGS